MFDLAKKIKKKHISINIKSSMSRSPVSEWIKANLVSSQEDKHK